MKISVIGAGNVGSLTAMRLGPEGLGDIILVDKVSGLAQGKALDLQDARAAVKSNYNILGTDDISQIRGSGIVVITAGLARKPGESRQDLSRKNARIVKEISLKIKELAPESIVIVVTNPVDLMAHLCLKTTGFNPNKIIGMGASLDASRFANLISAELNIPLTDIDACVIGAHGEGMLPLENFTNIKGINLDEFIDDKKMESLANRAINRGAEIVSLLGSGSAYFAPSAAIAVIVRSIVKDEKRLLGASAYLNGEYSLKDVYIGAPCRIGKSGIEGIVELELTAEQKQLFRETANRLKQQFSDLEQSSNDL